jgi:two-component system, NarL family, sensor histidine kinase LiaS
MKGNSVRSLRMRLLVMAVSHTLLTILPPIFVLVIADTVDEWRASTIPRTSLVGEVTVAMLGVTSLILGASLPVTLAVSLVTVRPLARRLQGIVHTSQALADGNLDARTYETARDELGQLGQQLDQMAMTIKLQLQELRTLAQHNSELMVALEQQARTNERASIGRDLHDTVAQHLFSLAMGTAALATHIRRDPEHAAQQAEQLAVIATQAQDELRVVLAQLRPASLIKGSFIEMLTEFVQQWSEHYTIPVTMNIQLSTTTLPLLVETILYRVCQEGLHNVARHAQAHHVTLAVTQHTGSVHLDLIDDGHGFDQEQQRTGLGLLGMGERVRSVGGTLTVETRSEQGTHLHIAIPLVEAKE